LIRDKRGNLCARYFKRADGTVVTQDCPVGQRARRRGVAIAAGAITALTAGAVYSEHARVEHTMGSIGSIDAADPPQELMGTLPALEPGAMPEPPEPPEPPPVESVLPTECDLYRIELRALAECDGIPRPSVRALDAAWQQVQVAWQNVTPETFESVRHACADGRQALADADDLECAAVDELRTRTWR
jgi:hypothetical protein